MDNPFGIPWLAPYLPVADVLATLSAPVAFLGAVAAVTTRFRRGTSVEREQIKWLLAVAALGASAFSVALVTPLVAPGSRVADASWLLGFAALAALPVSIGVAILRYRLYEIDRIVSRTVAWALLTAVLVGVFALVVVGLQALLGGMTQGETLAVAGSTLAAFALFQPLRRRVQAAVDRRFNRARYDGERLSAEFGESMRRQVEIDAAKASLRTAVSRAVQPAFTAVWLRQGGDR